MPVALSYPGVYIDERPSDVHTVTGVATSITAFIGRTLRGPTDQAMLVTSYADFTRLYGALWADSTLSYAVQQFFTNGGNQAVIVRVQKDAAASTATLAAGLNLSAASEGKWGEQLMARVDWDTRPGDPALFNLFLRDGGTGATETFRNVSVKNTDARYLPTVLKQQSLLARVTAMPATRPAESGKPDPNKDPFSNPAWYTAFGPGSDGAPITDDEITGTGGVGGYHLLDHVDLLNLMCIPPLQRGVDLKPATWDLAAAYCFDRRAVLIVDAPDKWTSVAVAVADMNANNFIAPVNNTAIYFPRLLIPDPLIENRLAAFAPCGVVAGICARTDTQRGVWKAPAGINATLVNVAGLTLDGENPALLTDPDNGRINPLGVNCLRSFPVIGRVVWGARTGRGADALADQWKYLPVRRLAFYIEESLYRGTQWVVFEPNDEPLWAQIRMNIGDFMQTLFRQGAFQGKSASDAYFVRCNSETTTQTDIDNGVVNIIVGFAPLKPAEFVVIQIQQKTAHTS
ncbi:phage tail sheath family protein [Paraburkholderia rhizosphaerae]|uniref:Tail sheath protein C-terminal domain-containing protein n=1 Tax=Paraburkholderia rhizosphaerae TaxID=480658 RepID=A0A4R8LTS2_9BURK|nr:phage tail sheath C-terminal domain-containing protein [Paraburkholderia rhizosphaerae]TDY50918.1 hypothetical protein BX592_108155 [Paraburkholderia rhizosphaerae]